MHWFEAFLVVPFSAQNSPPCFCHRALGRKNLLIPPGIILSKICFPQQAEDDLKRYVFYIFYDLQFFNCDGFTVL